ncbi:MAG: hypothetical protein JRJ65_10670, partial [Deltaproteobacteria bacterium]|nr:hypothetical protein [Deltaproteobacteria bacterium]
MRFGSVDTFIEPGDWGFRIGRPVANESFLKALLTYGTYDQYEFFCPDLFHMEGFSERIRELLDDSELISRVKPSLQIALAESMVSERHDIFHLGDFTYFMPYLIAMRNQYDCRPFPITGITHSLDSVHMNLRFMELITAGLTSFDGIICTSMCAEKMIKKGLAHTADLLNKNIGFCNIPDIKLKQIPLGIDDSFFMDIDKAEARKHLNIPQNMVVALSVG